MEDIFLDFLAISCRRSFVGKGEATFDWVGFYPLPIIRLFYVITGKKSVPYSGLYDHNFFIQLEILICSGRIIVGEHNINCRSAIKNTK